MPDEFYQNYLEISRTDLRRNADAVVKHMGCPVIGVVKCDGYGVSTAEAADAWKAVGVKTFAVSDPCEALNLREYGYTSENILLMTPVADARILQKMVENRVILTISGIRCAEFYAGAGVPVRVHVAVDTGMGRFGTRWNGFEELKEIYRLKNLRFEGIFSHFSASFEKKYDLTKKQLERFLETVEVLQKSGVDVGMRHIANSCAALRFPQTRLDAVRIGSALVGRLPVPVPVPLKRVGTFRAMVVDRRTLLKGDTAGYASICRLKHDTDVAIVSIGRHSGFGIQKCVDSFRLSELLRGFSQTYRSYKHGLAVEWKGSLLPVVGRVGSQYTLVDARDTNLRPGDYVSCPSVDIGFPNLHRKYV